MPIPAIRRPGQSCRSGLIFEPHLNRQLKRGLRHIPSGETEALVRENSGRSIPADELPVSSKREIVLRMLRNLMGVAQNKDAPADLLRYVEPMVALQPDSAFDRWARAVLLIQSRRFDAAKKDLEWLLQAKPEGMDLGRVLEIYQSLQ